MTMKWTGLRTRSISAVLLSALMMVSCTSFKVVKPDDIQAGLKAGDTVKIVTKDGRDLELKILTTTPEALVGTPVSSVGTAEASDVKDQRVEFSEIAKLEKREISPGKTVGLVAGIVASVALFLVLMAAVIAAAGQAALASQI